MDRGVLAEWECWSMYRSDSRLGGRECAAMSLRRTRNEPGRAATEPAPLVGKEPLDKGLPPWPSFPPSLRIQKPTDRATSDIPLNSSVVIQPFNRL
jgi:hypothetical protein